MKLNLTKRPAILKFQDDERARRYLDLKETDKATHNEEKMSNLKMDVSTSQQGLLGLQRSQLCQRFQEIIVLTSAKLTNIGIFKKCTKSDIISTIQITQSRLN